MPIQNTVVLYEMGVVPFQEAADRIGGRSGGRFRNGEKPRELLDFFKAGGIHEVLFDPDIATPPALLGVLLGQKKALDRAVVWVDAVKEFYPPAAYRVGCRWRSFMCCVRTGRTSRGRRWSVCAARRSGR